MADDSVEKKKERTLLDVVSLLEEQVLLEQKRNAARFRAVTKALGVIAAKVELTHKDLKRGGIGATDEDADYLHGIVRILEKGEIAPPVHSRRNKNRKRKRDDDQ